MQTTVGVARISGSKKTHIFVIDMGGTWPDVFYPVCTNHYEDAVMVDDLLPEGTAVTCKLCRSVAKQVAALVLLPEGTSATCKRCITMVEKMAALVKDDE